MLLAANPGRSQGLLVLHGQILDDSTHELLSFATIAGPRHAVNTMSNETGRFIIKLADTAPNDSLLITHVGYQAISIPIDPKHNNLVVRLRQKPTQLSAAFVTGMDAIDIIKKAISRIPDNYPASPYQLGGFYRLTSRADDRIVELSEAVFDIFGTDYTTETNQFKLIKTRLDKDWNAFGWNGITMIKRPEGMIRVDFVGRIHKAVVLGDKDLSRHEFVYRGVVDYEGRPAYAISFDQRPEVKEALYRGTILIDTQSLAFLSLTRSLSPQGMPYWYLHSALDRAALYREQLEQTALSDSTIVTYQRYGSRYYLHHYYRFAVARLTGGNREHIDLNPITNETNYLVTRIDTADVHPFDQNELTPRTATIEFQASHRHPLNDKFWEDYNLIEASFNVDSAVDAIHCRNMSRNPSPH